MGDNIATVTVSGLQHGVTQAQIREMLAAYGFVEEVYLSEMPANGAQPPSISATVTYKTRTATEAAHAAAAKFSIASHAYASSSTGVSVAIATPASGGVSAPGLIPDASAHSQVPPPSGQYPVPHMGPPPPQQGYGGYGGYPAPQQPPSHYYGGYDAPPYGAYGAYPPMPPAAPYGYGGYGPPPGKGMGAPKAKAPAQPMGDEVKVFVGGLPMYCTETEVRHIFDSFGTITEVHLMNPSYKTGQRCAFVT